MPPRKRAAAAPAAAAVPATEVGAPRTESQLGLTKVQAAAATKGGDINTEETAAQAARRARAEAQRPVGNDVCALLWGDDGIAPPNERGWMADKL